MHISTFKWQFYFNRFESRPWWLHPTKNRVEKSIASCWCIELSNLLANRLNFTRERLRPKKRPKAKASREKKLIIIIITVLGIYNFLFRQVRSSYSWLRRPLWSYMEPISNFLVVEEGRLIGLREYKKNRKVFRKDFREIPIWRIFLFGGKTMNVFNGVSLTFEENRGLCGSVPSSESLKYTGTKAFWRKFEGQRSFWCEERQCTIF